MGTYIHTHTYVHTYIHTYVHTDRQADRLTHTQTHTHTDTDTHTHTQHKHTHTTQHTCVYQLPGKKIQEAPDLTIPNVLIKCSLVDAYIKHMNSQLESNTTSLINIENQ